MPRWLTSHFSLEEMVASQTAARKGIDNTPAAAIVDNLRLVCERLEEVRRAVGAPVFISSGYRCPALNRAVGGAAKSRHMDGLAVDFIIPAAGTALQVARAVAGCGVVFDQLIHEYGQWVHLGLAPWGVPPRRQMLSIFPGTGYLDGLKARPSP
jgi:hypothetical protein